MSKNVQQWRGRPSAVANGLSSMFCEENTAQNPPNFAVFFGGAQTPQDACVFWASQVRSAGLRPAATFASQGYFQLPCLLDSRTLLRVIDPRSVPGRADLPVGFGRPQVVPQIKRDPPSSEALWRAGMARRGKRCQATAIRQATFRFNCQRTHIRHSVRRDGGSRHRRRSTQKQLHK
jgi:hypothetical protein